MQTKPSRMWSDEADVMFDMMRANLQEQKLRIDEMINVVSARESLNKEIMEMYNELRALQEVDTVLEADRILVYLGTNNVFISQGMHFILLNCLRHGRLKRIDVLAKQMEFLLNEPLEKPSANNQSANGSGGVQLPNASSGKDSGGNELRRKRSVRRKSEADPVRTPRRANSGNAKKGTAKSASD